MKHLTTQLTNNFSRHDRQTLHYSIYRTDAMAGVVFVRQ